MAKTPKAATILDVARVAGVSRQTVTRALNGLPDISASTRQRVIDAARSLNYRPNRAAQGLVRGRDTTVGFVVEDLRNPYYPELASALSRIAAERGWSVILCDVGDNEQSATAQLTSLLRRVDALIITGCQAGSVGAIPLDVFKQSILGIPTVILDGSASHGFDAFVKFDHAAGVNTALHHLVTTGRRNIAMIDTLQIDSARREAYRQYLSANGLHWTSESECRTKETAVGGMTATAALLEQFPTMDAILAYNDVLAIGALKGLARAGVSVPETVRVIGIDGLDVGEMITPELTTLAINKTDLARNAVELLESLLGKNSPATADLQKTLSYQLILRESA